MKLKSFKLLVVVFIMLFAFATFLNAQTNVALGKTASQSSTRPAGGAASRAVDGNTNGNFASNSVTHTDVANSRNPWWEVDLGAIYEITEVRVWNRTDCCKERLSSFQVQFRTNSDPATNKVFNSSLYTGINPIVMNNVQRARYIRIQLLDSNGILSLAEVQVFGKLVRPSPTPVPIPKATPDSSSKSVPVVLPDSNNNRLRKYPFNLRSAFTDSNQNGSPIVNIHNYFDESEGRSEPRPAGPPTYTPPTYYNFDFAVNESGGLFYSPFSCNSCGFSNNSKSIFEINATTPFGLEKIGGVYGSQLFALTDNGKAVVAKIDFRSRTIKNATFTTYAKSNRFYTDIYVFMNKVWLLDSTGELLSYSFIQKKWNYFGKIVKLKHFNITYDYIYGINTNNELIAMKHDGSSRVTLLGNVMDFTIERANLFYIAAGTQTLMRSKVSGGKISEIRKVDEKATFTGFISKNKCIAKNGNGQIYFCQ